MGGPSWASSSVSDFNYDFNASFTPEQQRTGIEDNYRREPAFTLPPGTPDPDASPASLLAGTDAATFTRERPGMSAFLLENGVIYHTYSAYA